MEKVVFIDRDGVINKDPGGWTTFNYVTTWSEFIFFPNSIKAIKKLNDAGYDIIVVSNQGGVSKGYYSKEALRSVNQKMLEEIEAKGAKIKKVYYCIHQDSDNCDCRKPKTGLFEQAEKEFGIDLGGKYFVGDGKMDVEAGKKLGMRTILVLSGKTDLENIKEWEIKPHFVFRDLFEAVDFILKGRNS